MGINKKKVFFQTDEEMMDFLEKVDPKILQDDLKYFLDLEDDKDEYEINLDDEN